LDLAGCLFFPVGQPILRTVEAETFTHAFRFRCSTSALGTFAWRARLRAIVFVWTTSCSNVCNRTWHGRPCVRFRTSMPRGSLCGWSRGRRWLRLLSLQRLGIASRACVSPLPVCDTLSRFGTSARPRAFFAGPGNRSCWRALPLRFSDAQSGSRGDSRDAVHLPATWMLCWTGVEIFAVGHVMRLARDTHLAALSERDERTAGAHPDCGPCVRDPLRTVAQLRVMHLGRLFARRSATRIINGRRATWPTVWLRVRWTRCRADVAHVPAIGGAPGVRVALRRFDPTVGRMGVSTHSRPRVHVCHRHSFPDRFRRAAAGAS